MDFLEWLGTYWPEISAGAVSVAGAIVGIINAVRSRKMKNYLRNAKMRETYTVCPKCNARIPLSDLHFRLPSGEVDDDLNGIPD